MKILYIAWSDTVERKWYPVGRLCFDNNMYIFCYTEGARASSRFAPFGQMNDLTQIYTSQNLFPLFENRILNKKRPEFGDFLEWLGLDIDNYDPLEVLALTEGKRGTDSIEIFPCPQKGSDEMYRISFFAHGMRYLDKSYIDALRNIRAGDSLYLMFDIQNRYDERAITMRTDDPVKFVGYCPRYLAKDFRHLLDKVDHRLVRVEIERINYDAPLQYKIMCRATSPWPKGFSPCSDKYFKPIPDKLLCVNREECFGRDCTPRLFRNSIL